MKPGAVHAGVLRTGGVQAGNDGSSLHDSVDLHSELQRGTRPARRGV